MLEDLASVLDAEQRYAQRYRVPRENPERVVIVLDVDRVLGGDWTGRTRCHPRRSAT